MEVRSLSMLDANFDISHLAPSFSKAQEPVNFWTAARRLKRMDVVLSHICTVFDEAIMGEVA